MATDRINFLIVLILSFICLRFRTTTGHKIVSVRLFRQDNVLLDCHGSTMTGSSWLFNDKLLFSKHFFVGSTHRDLQLYENYTLFLKNVTFYQEGAYCCKRNFTDVACYIVAVQVLPQLTLSIGDDTFNGSWNLHTLSGEKAENLMITCKALRSRPLANLTWIVNDKDVGTDRVRSVSYRISKDSLYTFDSESSILLDPILKGVNISCQCRGSQVVYSNLTLNFLTDRVISTHNPRSRIHRLIICFLFLCLITFGIGIFLGRVLRNPPINCASLNSETTTGNESYRASSAIYLRPVSSNGQPSRNILKTRSCHIYEPVITKVKRCLPERYKP